MSWLGDVGSVVGAGAALLSLNKKQKNPALDAQMAEMNERRRLRDLALNPNSPEFRNMLAVEEEAVRSDFAKAITEAMRARKRATARGRVTTRPERFDETISAMQSRLTSGPQAQQRVQSRLLAASGTPDFANAIGAYSANNAWDTIRRDATIGAATKGAGALGNMWERYGQPSVVPSEWVGVTPGRKPIYEYDDRAGYDVWEDKA